MKVDSVITLENNINCLLLDEVKYDDNKYFLAVLLDEDEEPTDTSFVLKEIIENGETFVEREGDEAILAEITKLFTKSFNKFVSELPEEI